MGNWLNKVCGLFSGGPMDELAQLVELPKEEKKRAEDVEITDQFRKTFISREKMDDEQRNSFLFSMLVMAAYIAVADGKVEASECDNIRKFLAANFGTEAEQEGMDVVEKLIAKHKELQATKPMAYVQEIGKCGSQIAERLDKDLRYQLLSMLVMISKSDKEVSAAEVDALKDVAVYIGMQMSDIDALLNA